MTQQDSDTTRCSATSQDTPAPSVARVRGAGIPFTQFLRPHGKQRPVSIEMPQDIEALAFHFIESGGWFEVEELTTGHASLTACRVVDDEPQDIAIRVVDNGPPVVRAVEELVREAAAWTAPPQPERVSASDTSSTDPSSQTTPPAQSAES